MSAAFKVFLLIVLFFGACWAYQFRARDLQEWLEPGALRPLESDELPGLRSPVERVIDPGTQASAERALSSGAPNATGARFLASLRYEPPPPPPRIVRSVVTDQPPAAAAAAESAPTPPAAPKAEPPARRTPPKPQPDDPEEAPPVQIVFGKAPEKTAKTEKTAKPEKAEKTQKLAARKTERPAGPSAAPTRGTAAPSSAGLTRAMAVAASPEASPPAARRRSAARLRSAARRQSASDRRPPRKPRGRPQGNACLAGAPLLRKRYREVEGDLRREPGTARRSALASARHGPGHPGRHLRSAPARRRGSAVREGVAGGEDATRGEARFEDDERSEFMRGENMEEDRSGAARAGGLGAARRI